jgi:hypothetical protein
MWRTPSTPTWFALLSEQDFGERAAMVADEAVGAAGCGWHCHFGRK